MIYTSEARLEITEAGAYYRRINKELACEFKQRLASALGTSSAIQKRGESSTRNTTASS
ncbi:MAG: hypothetical protein ABL974_23450 [Prosthecobacter sp.]